MPSAQSEVLLHIGLHKCGSTFLQDTVFANPEYGFRAPWGAMTSRAVTDFVFCDPLEFDAETLRGIYASSDPGPGADGKGKVPVVSHEALSSRPHHGRYYAPEVAHRLHAVFPDARVLIVFREQKAILRSLHVQHIRNGGVQSLQTFLGTGDEPDGWAPLILHGFFEYDRLIRFYQSVFGDDRVLALPLELLQKDPADFARRLFEFNGLPPVTVESTKRVNAAWPRPLMELYRRTNGMLPANPLGPKNSTAHRFRERLMWSISKRAPKGWGKAGTERDKAFLQQRIGTRFAASNARTALLTGIDLSALGYPVETPEAGNPR